MMTNDQPKQPNGVRLDAYILRAIQWAALVRLWRAGENGIDRDELLYGRGCFAWTKTLRRLYEYQPEPLMEHFKPSSMPYSGSYRLTDAGQRFYREQWSFYRARYSTLLSKHPNQTTRNPIRVHTASDPAVRHDA